MEFDYVNRPQKTLDELFELYTADMYLILDDVLSSKRTYRLVYQNLIDILKWGFEIIEIRNRPINFKFHKDDTKIYHLTIRNFISNLIIWAPFMDCDKVEILDESFLFDFVHYDSGKLADYIDQKILTNYDGDFYSKNRIIDEIFYHITAISNAFSLLIGAGFSIYSVYQSQKRNPEMEDLIFGKLHPEMQPTEIEEELTRRTKRLIEIFKTDAGDNDLKPLFLSGKKNLSEAQFKEIMVRIGLKADVNGHTIPWVIDANFMVTGLNKPSYVHINNISGRKSLIMSKTQMGIPGAFSRKLNYDVTPSSILRKDDEICDSAAAIVYEIKDELWLELLNGRYYYDERGAMRQLDSTRDTHLIGKIVPFRSPATCNSHEGICHYCYGHLSEINGDLFSVGSLAATKTSEPLGQGILSAKHSQTTNSDEIKFDPSFDDLFELSSSEISLNENSDSDDELFIVLDDVQFEESDDTEFYYTTRIKIINASNEVVYNLEEQNQSKMYLSNELIVLYKRNKVKSAPISLDQLDSDSPLFNIEIKNKELSDPIKIVQKIINNNDHMGAKTVSELCQVFAENLIEMGNRYDLVHAECIIRSLLRKKSNPLEFPDWSRAGDPEDYIMMRLNNALLHNDSPLISMSYGYLRKQLVGTELYEKSGASHIDPLFVTDLKDYIHD